jgi:hypothetical protein
MRFLFLIKLKVFLASGARSYETSFQKVEVGSILCPLAIRRLVEPTPVFVGFRCTQSNLHVTGIIAK